MPHHNRNIKNLREKKKEMNLVSQSAAAAPQQVVQITQEQLDVIVIDLTLRELFNNGDKTIIDFNKDVIEKYNIPVNERTVERYWDILDATQFVNPVVGFGNANKLSITPQGYNVMLQFGNYQNYLNTISQGKAQPIMQSNDTAEEEQTTEDVEITEVKEDKEVRRKRDDKTF